MSPYLRLALAALGAAILALSMGGAFATGQELPHSALPLPVSATPAASTPTWTQFSYPSNASVPGSVSGYFMWDESERADIYLAQHSDEHVYYYYGGNNTWRATPGYLYQMGPNDGVGEYLIGAAYNWQDGVIDFEVQGAGTCGPSGVVCFFTYTHGSIRELVTYSENSCNGLTAWDAGDHYIWWVDSQSPSHTYTIVNNTVTQSAAANSPASQCNMGSAAVWDSTDRYLLYNPDSGSTFQSYVGGAYTPRSAPYACEYMSLEFDESPGILAPVAYGCAAGGETHQFVWTGSSWTDDGVPSGTPTSAGTYTTSTYDPILGRVMVVTTPNGGGVANGLWGVGPNLTGFIAGASSAPNPTTAGWTEVFNGTASGGAPTYTWSWRFGDGGSAAVRNPSHKYLQPATYIAKLWVNDTQSKSAVAQTSTLVLAPLIANVTLSSYNVQVRTPVTASASATGGSGLSYAWNENGTSPLSCSGPVCSVPTSHPSTYLVNLTVTDAYSRHNWSESPLVVEAPTVLSAVARATPTSGPAPLNVSFNGTASGGLPGFAFTWNFGDGGHSYARNPLHSYNTSGTWNAQVWVNDSFGDHATSNVSILLLRPVTVMLSPSQTSLQLGGAVDLLASPSGGTGFWSLFEWSALPPGCSSRNASNLGCTPSSVGHYNVTATVTDTRGDVGSGTAEVDVYRVPLPLLANLVASPASLPVGQWTWLNSTVSGGSGTYPSYSWSGLPTGCSASNQPDLHCLPSGAGHYNITVTVQDSNGATASSTSELDAYALPASLSVVLGAAPSVFAEGSSTSLTAIASGGTGSYVQYAWTLPTGCAATNQAILQCKPAHAGTFLVVVEVTDSGGHSASADTNITVRPVAGTASGGNPLLSPATLAVLAILAAAIGFVILWGALSRRRRSAQARSFSSPRAPTPPPIQGTATTSGAGPASWAPLPPPPAGYYADVAWSSPREEWDEEPEKVFGNYPVRPSAPGASANSPRLDLARAPWMMSITPRGIEVEGVGAGTVGPSTGPSTRGDDDTAITSSFQEDETASDHVESPSPVTPDHAYAILQALDRRPRSLDSLRQVIRLEDLWLLGLMSALVQARLVASGTNTKSQQTVFALTPIGRRLARRSFSGPDEPPPAKPRLGPVKQARPPLGSRVSPSPHPTNPPQLERGSKLTDVRRIGKERGTLDEQSPFEGLRPEDVNPQLKGQKSLPKSVLQPMEMRVSQDRGTDTRETTEAKDTDARARDLMIAAKKAREEKNRKLKLGVEQARRPRDDSNAEP